MATPASHIAGHRLQERLPLVFEPLFPTSPQTLIDAAKTLLREYGHFVTSQPGVASFCLDTFEIEVAGLPHSFARKDGSAGAFLAHTIVPTMQTEPLQDPRNWIGFIAWRTLPLPHLADSWEIKRLWVRPEARGKGAGRTLLQSVIAQASAAGKSRLLLDTAPEAMSAAVRLYETLGFAPCSPYAGKAKPGIVYMSKAL